MRGHTSVPRRLLHAVLAALVVSVAASAVFAGQASGALPAGSFVFDGSIDAAEYVGGHTYLGGSFTAQHAATGAGVLVAAGGEGAVDTAVFPRVEGRVSAVAADGAGGWYVGGRFTRIGGVARHNLARVTISGAVDPVWKPVADGDVTGLAVTAGRVYLTGAFTTVGNRSRAGLASIDADTGEVADWAPRMGGTGFGRAAVSTLAVSGTKVYIGGLFSAVDGTARSGLAAFDASTGAVASWAPRVNVYGGVAALAISGSTVYVGGTFSQVSGVTRPGLAAVDAESGAVSSWDPALQGTPILPPVDPPGGEVPEPRPQLYGPAQVTALTVSGSTVYVAGMFSSVGGAPRAGLAAIDAGSGTATPWQPTIGGQGVRLLATAGGDVFLAGAFGTVGGVTRAGAAAVDGVTGAVRPWDPKVRGEIHGLAAAGGAVFLGGAIAGAGEPLARVHGLARLDADGALDTDWRPSPDGPVWALEARDGTLYAAGDFQHIGGQERRSLAALDLSSSSVTPWDPAPNGAVHVLSADDTRVYFGGSFDAVGGVARSGLAAVAVDGGALAPWSPAWPASASGSPGSVGQLVAGDGVVYVGGRFDRIGATARTDLAALDAASGEPTAWDARIVSTGEWRSGVSSLELDAGTLYVAGWFWELGGGVQRPGVAALEAATGEPTAWRPSAVVAPFDGPPVAWPGSYGGGPALAVADDVVHVSGWRPATAGGVGAFGTHIVALDRVSGAPTAWSPGVDVGGSGPAGIAVAGARLVLTSWMISTTTNEESGSVTFAERAPSAATIAPSVTVARPLAGERFERGVAVPAEFACDAEGGAPIVACSAPTRVDTATTGSAAFTVTALNAAGIATQRTVAYMVDPPASTGGPWHASEPVSSIGERGAQPQVAVDPAGRATALYVAIDAEPAAGADPTGRVRVASRRRGGGPAGLASWEAETVSSEGVAAGGADLAVGPAGDRIAAWVERDPEGPTVRVATAGAGGAWSAAALSRGAGTVSGVRAVVDGDGVATVVWARHESLYSWSVEAATLRPGEAWSQPARIGAGDANMWHGPDLGIDGTGALTVVWTMAGSVHAATRPEPDAAWSAPEPVDEKLGGLGGAALDPLVEVAPDGRAVAVWTDAAAQEQSVVAARRDGEGRWEAPVALFALADHSYAVARATIARDGDATVIARLDEIGGSPLTLLNSRIAVRDRSAAAPAWSAERPLAASLSSPLSAPALGVSGSGTLTALWAPTGLGAGLLSARKPASGEWSEPLAVDPIATAVTQEAAVGVADNGAETAIWLSRGGITDRAVRAAARGVVPVADPPQTTIVSGPDELGNDPTPTFELAADQASASFECALDDSPFEPCPTPFTTSRLDDGEHTFAARARNAEGDVDASPATFSFTIDTVPPKSAIESGPPALGRVVDVTFAFASDEPGTLTCALDEEAFEVCSSPLSLHVQDGEHRFRVRAVDLAGNLDPTPAEHRFTVDTRPPTTTIASGPEGTVDVSTVTFELESDEPDATFECAHDGGAFAPCVPPVTRADLPDGDHEIAIRATDPAGNREQSAVVRDYVIEAVPPETERGSGPPALGRETSATFAFASSERPSTFECSLDGAPFAACEQPATVDDLDDREHVFRARAVDRAGKRDETPAAWTFVVDTRAPSVVAIEGPGAFTATARPTFSFEADEPVERWECAVDDRPPVTCSAAYTTPRLDDGEHAVRVRAIDAAGNVGAFALSDPFVVDTVPPQTTITDGPAALIARDHAELAFEADEPARFRCAVDGGAPRPCESPLALTDLRDGAHTAQVTATDRAGNAEPTPAQREFVVDTTPPRVTITAKPPALTAAADAEVAFSADEIADFRCALDGAEPSPCESPIRYDDLDDGAHRVAVAATDPAGNETVDPVEARFVVDTTPPQTTIDERPDSPVRDRVARFAFSSDEEGATFRCSLDGAEATPCTSPFSATIARDGTHTFAVDAIDRAGNADPTPASEEFVVDTPNTPPTASLALDRSGGTAPLRVRATLAADDVDEDELAYRLSFGDGSPVVSGTLPADPVEHVYERAGSFRVQLTVEDGEATVERTARVTVSAPEPLVAEAGDARRGVVGESIAFDAGGSRPRQAFDAFRWEFGDGATADGDRVAHAFANAGTYTVRMRASAGAEEVVDTTTVTVAPAGTSDGLRVRARSGGAPLAGAEAIYVAPDGSRQSATADGAGLARLRGLPDGPVTVYVWATGHRPVAVRANVSDGEGEVAAELERGEVGIATLDADRMTLEEIQAAGIDVTDPDNYHVYEANIHLNFTPETEWHVYVSRNGVSCASDCVPPGGGGGPGGPLPHGWGCQTDEGFTCLIVGGYRYWPQVQYVAGEPIVSWLVLPMRASFLKEMFDVQLVVQNLAGGFDFAPGVASLQLPSGVSLASMTGSRQTLDQAVETIPAGESRTARWYVRGDIEGDYDLEASYSSAIEPFGKPVFLRARTREPMRVWAASALKTRIIVDRRAVRWGPYAVDVEFENVTGAGGQVGTPVYNLQVEMFDRSDDAPPEHAEFVYAPEATSESATTKGIDVLEPGRRWTASFVVFAGLGNSVTDPLEVFRTNKRLSFVQRTGGDVDLNPEIALRGTEADDPSLGPPAGMVRAPVVKGQRDAIGLTWTRTPASSLPPGSAAVTDYEVWARQALTGGRWEHYDTVPSTGDSEQALAIPSRDRAVGRYYAIGTRTADGRVHFRHRLAAGAARYVSLGDSYSSGEGVPEFEPGTARDLTFDPADNNCHRSWQGSYGRRLLKDETVDANLQPAVFAACSGAVTRDFDDPDGNPENDGEPAQKAHLSDFTNLVTLTAGGNDIGFGDIAVMCLVMRCDATLEGLDAIGSTPWMDNLADMWLVGGVYGQAVKDVMIAGRSCGSLVDLLGKVLCAQKIGKAMRSIDEVANFDSARVATTRNLYNGTLLARLKRIYRAIAEEAPNARVLVQPYPPIVDTSHPEATCELIPFSPLRLSGGDRVGIARVIFELNADIEQAVREVNAEVGRPQFALTKPEMHFQGHELCRDGELNPDTYFNSVVNPFLSSPGNYGSVAYSFHPNAYGQQAYADAAAAALAGDPTGQVHRVGPHAHTRAGTVFVPHGARRLVATSASRGAAAAARLALAAADSGGVRLSLVSPAGEAFDRDTPGVTATAADGAETLEITDPQPGTWTVRLFGEAVPQDGTLAEVTAFADVPSRPAPEIAMSARRVSGYARLFDFEARGADAAAYRWSFSDGGSAQGATVRHAFENAGGQWATVEAIPDGGGTSGWQTVRLGPPDLTAPQVSLEAPAAALDTRDATPRIAGRAGAAEEGEGQARDLAQVRVDLYAGGAATGAPLLTLTAPRASDGAWEVAPDVGLSDGTYTVRARQSDDAGNEGSSPPHTFRVDTTTPAPSLGAPADGAALRETRPQLRGDGGREDGSNPARSADAAEVAVQLWRGRSAAGPPTRTASAAVGADGVWTLTPEPALPEGPWTARVEQADAAGNIGRTGARTFVIDLAAPSPTIDPLGDTANRTPRLVGAAGGEDDRGVGSADDASVAIRVWSGNATSGAPARSLTAARAGTRWSLHVEPALQDGTWTAVARQGDAAGNAADSAQQTFKVDATAPAVSIAEPAAGSVVPDGAPAFAGGAGAASGLERAAVADATGVLVEVFAGDGAGAAGSALRTLETARVGAAWQVAIPPGQPLAPGRYTARATQSDALGNIGSATVTFIVPGAPDVGGGGGSGHSGGGDQGGASGGSGASGGGGRAGGGSGGDSPGGPRPILPPAPLSTSARTATVDRRGSFALPLRCTQRGECRARLTVTAAVRSGGRRARAKEVQIARATVRVAGRASRPVLVKLTARGRALVRQPGGRLHATVTIAMPGSRARRIAIVLRGPAGGAAAASR